MSILDVVSPLADARIIYGTDPAHFGDLWLPEGEGPFPVITNIHGGFWRAKYDLTHAGPLCEALTVQGYAVWNLEYRRIGHAGGGWPGTFNDVVSGLRFVKTIAHEYPLDLDRTLVMGHSAGGHLALWGAGRIKDPAPRGVVALAPVADLHRAWELGLSDNVVESLLGGSPDVQEERYMVASPIRNLPLGIPVCLVHGALDTIVPKEISARYVQAARQAGDRATLVSLPNADHFDIIDPRTKAWGAVLIAIKQILHRTPRGNS